MSRRLDATPACLECGADLGSDRATAVFCCTPCRKTWNNRRMQRGAELYDLFMAFRFERPLARVLRVMSMLNRLASQYRDADRRERAGRRSWTSPDVVVERAPHLRASILQRGG